MAQALGKEKTKKALKDLDCQSEYDAWQKAQPLDDEDAARLENLADENEGIPRLRELDGYLLLDTGDGETIVVFKDAKGTRRELLGQLTPSVTAGDQPPAQTNALIERQDRIEDYEDREPELQEVSSIEWISDEYIDEDFVPDEEPKYEVGPTIGKPRAGKRRSS